MNEEEQSLYDRLRSLHFDHDAAMYSMRKLIDLKKRIDRKYIEGLGDTPFLSLSN